MEQNSVTEMEFNYSRKVPTRTVETITWIIEYKLTMNTDLQLFTKTYFIRIGNLKHILHSRYLKFSGVFMTCYDVL